MKLRALYRLAQHFTRARPLSPDSHRVLCFVMCMSFVCILLDMKAWAPHPPLHVSTGQGASVPLCRLQGTQGSDLKYDCPSVPQLAFGK